MGVFGGLDWAVVGLYFILVFAVAVWAGREEKGRDTGDYFLAGRNVGWFVIGASVFASNIGSEHLIGLAGAGASGGVAVAQFEILAGFVLLILGWLFVPFYLASGVFTMPEFLERRYSAGPRYYLAGVSIIGYVLTKISVTIAAGGIVFNALMGIDFWTGAVIVVLATGAYTVWGGLRAVLYTDMIQMIILIAGAVAVTAIGLHAVGGWSAMVEAAPKGAMSLWKPMSHPDFPWTGILFGAPILAVWYWCTDQFIVQRVLSARGIEDARRGTIFAAFLKQTPLFIFVLPGVIAAVLAQRGLFTLEDADAALPTLIGALLPAGLKGLLAAGLLAALMSSLSSVFNSCATLFTVDIYKKIKPDAGERQLVLVGQGAVLVMVAFGLLWIPFMDAISGQLFTYIQSVQAYLSPPIAAIFLFGVLWRRANAAGAIATLAVGFVLGMGRLTLEVNAGATAGTVLEGFVAINFLHFAAFMFLACVATLIAVSLMTPAPEPAKTQGLTLGGGAAAGVAAYPDAAPKRLTDKLLSFAVLVLIGVVWVVFS